MELDLRWAVLASISRLYERRGRFLGPTIEEVLEDLEKRYGVRYTRRHIEGVVADLEKRGLVQRKRGLLRDGRVTLLTTTKGERVVLTLIRIGGNEALVHDGWEGILYDPPGSVSGGPNERMCVHCGRPITSGQEWTSVDGEHFHWACYESIKPRGYVAVRFLQPCDQFDVGDVAWVPGNVGLALCNAGVCRLAEDAMGFR
jgi:DNA-binding MarR family transcriptional regulator